MKFTQIPSDTFKQLQINAGIICSGFDPSTGEITNLLGATTGGFRVAANPTYEDFGEDIDNVPGNTWQLKRILSYDPFASGTFLTVDPDSAKSLVGAGSVDGAHIVPANELSESDFEDVWIIGDYSDVNTGASAGFLAVHLMFALNTAGFQWQSAKNGKGQFAFEYHGHYDLTDIDTVPFDVYVQEGEHTLDSITVTSTDSGVTTSGDSKISMSGYTLKSGEKFVYKTATSTAPSVEYGQTLTTGWAEITSGSTITVTASHTKITVAAIGSDNKAVASGSATLTIKA